jgi:hypothetical protein
MVCGMLVDDVNGSRLQGLQTFRCFKVAVGNDKVGTMPLMSWAGPCWKCYCYTYLGHLR